MWVRDLDHLVDDELLGLLGNDLDHTRFYWRTLLSRGLKRLKLRYRVRYGPPYRH